jgi:hypothetical protein
MGLTATAPLSAHQNYLQPVPITAFRDFKLCLSRLGLMAAYHSKSRYRLSTTFFVQYPFVINLFSAKWV